MLAQLLRLLCIGWIAMVLGGLFMYVGIQIKEQVAINKENMKCVHRLVAQGIERRNINQIDGRCYVYTNAYYSPIK